MEILALGHNHDTATVELREQFAFSTDRLDQALTAVRALDSVVETVILSTCNRNEIYSIVKDPAAAQSDIARFFYEFHRVDRGLIDHTLYTLQQDRAVEHLFAVASGIDSMVVGETQIFSQVKEAYDRARLSANTGPILNRLFTHSFEAGKKVRSTTSISTGAVSVSSCAVDLARKIFTDIANQTTLIIGAGETSEQTAIHLHSHGASNFVVANRTVEHAAELADRFGGSGIPLEQIDSELLRADIVISSTAASDYLITRDRIKEIMSKRKNAPLFLIDLSVPRDIEPSSGDLYNVFLYDIDALSSIAEANRSKRETESEAGRIIVREEVNQFMQWYRSLRVTPTVVSLRRAFEDTRQSELDRLRHQVSDAEFERLEQLSRSIVNKLLHHPSEEIKRSVERGDDAYFAYAMRRLFDLEAADDE